MTHRSETTQFMYMLPEAALERTRAQACNRIILYGHGMDLSAESCLELAAESLRRAPANAGLEEILTAMHRILDERAGEHALANDAGAPKRAAPPVRRHSMVSSGERCQSLLGWAGSGLAGLVGAVACLIVPWKNRKA